MELLSFGDKHWSAEIAEITGQQEYQTCEIQIIDPSKVERGEYDIDTGEQEITLLPGYELYAGQARFIPVRRAVNYEGATQNNSKAISAIRVQVTSQELPVRLPKGTTAKITSAPRNPMLETLVLYLSTAVQGSSAATRTLEFNVDGDAVYG